MCARMHALFACMSAMYNVCVFVCFCMCAFMYVCMHAFMSACLFYVCMYVVMCVCVRALERMIQMNIILSVNWSHIM